MLKRVNNFGVTYGIMKKKKKKRNKCRMVKGIKSRKRQYEIERYQHNN